MKHGIEIALIDRQTPFGNEFLLPRGTLREPPGNLRRATHLFITKCSAGEDNSELITRIRKYNRTADIIECSHHPQHLRNLVTGEILPLEFSAGPRSRARSAASPRRRASKAALREAGRRGGAFQDLHGPPPLYDAGDRKLHPALRQARPAGDHHHGKRRRAHSREFSNPEVPIYYLRVEIEILARPGKLAAVRGSAHHQPPGDGAAAVF